MTARASIAVLLAALVGLIAVASGPAAVTAPRTACGLLLRREVAKAIGERVRSVSGGATPTGAVFCNYTGADGKILPRGIALIAATGNVDVRWKGYASLLPNAKPVKGVGVRALSTGEIFLVRSKTALVQVGPLYANAGIPPSAIRALAVTALTRASR